MSTKPNIHARLDRRRQELQLFENRGSFVSGRAGLGRRRRNRNGSCPAAPLFSLLPPTFTPARATMSPLGLGSGEAVVDRTVDGGGRIRPAFRDSRLEARG